MSYKTSYWCNRFYFGWWINLQKTSQTGFTISEFFPTMSLKSFCRAKKVLSSLNIFSLTFLQSLQITSNHSFYYPPILRKTVKAVTKTTSDKVTKIKNIDGNSDLSRLWKCQIAYYFRNLDKKTSLMQILPKWISDNVYNGSLPCGHPVIQPPRHYAQTKTNNAPNQSSVSHFLI